jgi:FAD synthetase
MKKVMAFGTFDIIHPGHEYFLRESKKEGDYLIVVIARDLNVTRVKGKPHNDEKTRLNNVKSMNIADEVLLGEKVINYDIINNNKPNVICVGYDQDTLGVEKLFPNIEIKKIGSHKPDVFKSSKLRPK